MISGPVDASPLRGWTVSNLKSDWLEDVDPDLCGEGFKGSDHSFVSRSGEALIATFEGIARFKISFPAKTITVFDMQPAATPDDVEHLLHDQLYPRILAESGMLVLHGSAVEIHGRLAVFLGETGAGKSTLAASLHEAGHRLLGDDAVIVEASGDAFTGRAVYPSLRLFPATATAILGEDVATAPMAHYSEKRRVLLDRREPLAEKPVELGAVFFLTGRSDTATPSANRLSVSESCMAMVEQSFTLDPQNARQAAQRLSRIAQIANAVPGYRLSNPHDFEQVADLHSVILDTMALSETAEPCASSEAAD